MTYMAILMNPFDLRCENVTFSVGDFLSCLN